MSSVSSVEIMDHNTDPTAPAASEPIQPTITFLSLGAIVHTFRVGGLKIVQNFPTTALYEKYNDPFFGETIGRVANRISGAKINNLNGRSYQLAANNGPNALHGGVRGWGKRTFEGPKTVTRNGKEVIAFTYVSADGEEGYPGEVELRVFYSTSTSHIEGKAVVDLDIEYEAELLSGSGVEETAVAVTNHR